MAKRALIVDDHELMRDAMRRLVRDELGIEEVLEAETFEQALAHLTCVDSGDLVILDLRMPGLSGPEAVAALCDGFPQTKVAVISASEERTDILAALDAGARGYIPKSLSAIEIADALRSIMEGRMFLPAAFGRREPGVCRAPTRRSEGAPMTARQKQVLEELLKGQASKQIARTLCIAEGTVKIHLAAIYRALGVRTRAEAIAKLAAGR